MYSCRSIIFSPLREGGGGRERERMGEREMEGENWPRPLKTERKAFFAALRPVFKANKH